MAQSQKVRSLCPTQGFQTRALLTWILGFENAKSRFWVRVYVVTEKNVNKRCLRAVVSPYSTPTDSE